MIARILETPDICDIKLFVAHANDLNNFTETIDKRPIARSGLDAFINDLEFNPVDSATNRNSVMAFGPATGIFKAAMRFRKLF